MPEYREIAGAPGCRFGDDGSMWSRWNIGSKGGLGTEWRQLKGSLNREGYPYVALYRDGKRFKHLLHRLILEAFVGPCPPGMEGCHNDGDPANNRLANLRWDTPKSNMADCVRHGTMPHGERSGSAKLTENDVVEIRRLRGDGWTQKEIAKNFRVDQSLVSLIVNRKIWQSIQ